MSIIEGFASEGVEFCAERNSWGGVAGYTLQCDAHQLRLHASWLWPTVTVTDDEGVNVLSGRLSMEFLFLIRLWCGKRVRLAWCTVDDQRIPVAIQGCRENHTFLGDDCILIKGSQDCRPGPEFDRSNPQHLAPVLLLAVTEALQD